MNYTTKYLKIQENKQTKQTWIRFGSPRGGKTSMVTEVYHDRSNTVRATKDHTLLMIKHLVELGYEVHEPGTLIVDTEF